MADSITLEGTGAYFRTRRCKIAFVRPHDIMDILSGWRYPGAAVVRLPVLKNLPPLARLEQVRYDNARDMFELLISHPSWSETPCGGVYPYLNDVTGDYQKENPEESVLSYEYVVLNTWLLESLREMAEDAGAGAKPDHKLMLEAYRIMRAGTTPTPSTDDAEPMTELQRARLAVLDDLDNGQWARLRVLADIAEEEGNDIQARGYRYMAKHKHWPLLRTDKGEVHRYVVSDVAPTTFPRSAHWIPGSQTYEGGRSEYATLAQVLSDMATKIGEWLLSSPPPTRSESL